VIRRFWADRGVYRPLPSIAAFVEGSYNPGFRHDRPEMGDERLDSWKEIAGYLKRDVTTVQRWEKREGMPVHRHLHDKLGSVYAYRSELDAWTQSRNVGLTRDEGNSNEPVAQAGGTSVPARTARSWTAAFAAMVVVLVCVGTYAWLRARTEFFWRNPVADVQSKRVDDGGTERAAAISRDGRLVAFQSDHNGQVDVVLTQTGTGDFYNLTQGRFPGLVNDLVRALAFSPDGAFVTFWVRHGEAGADIWEVPVLGGKPQLYLEGTGEVDWSNDGSLLVYHTTGPGDPTFIRSPGQGGKDREVLAARPGLHAHFPTWSPDRQFIYFVRGEIASGTDLRNSDVWRVNASGGAPERITHHNSRVTHPVLLDDRTLMYLATDDDGSGPWLYTMDVNRRVAHQVSPGIEAFTSLAASADGRQLVATVPHPQGTLWRVPLGDRPVDGSEGSLISLTTGPGVLPRLGPDYLLYVSSTGSGDGIWKIGTGAGDSATSLWSGAGGRIFGVPAIDSDGKRIAFSVRQRGKTLLYVMNADGTQARIVTSALTLVGSPVWQPGGNVVTSSASVNGTPRLYQISLDGSVTPLSQEYAIDPVWSSDGRFVVYSGPDVGTSFPLNAVTAGGAPFPLPNLKLPRGARRVRFVDHGRAIVVMRGDIQHKDLWRIDLATGADRQLTRLAADFNIEDFDISSDERDIVLERIQDRSDVVLITVR
jgi:Tol biopolymer transport system component